MSDQKFTPKIKLVAIEETENWDPSITAVLGRVFGVYAYDEILHVHICSFTPSHWLEFVENVFENYFEDGSPELAGINIQSMTDLMYENGGERGCYMDVRDIERISDDLKDDLGACGFELGAHDDMDDYEKRFSDLVGELCCNGISVNPFKSTEPVA